MNKTNLNNLAPFDLIHACKDFEKHLKYEPLIRFSSIKPVTLFDLIYYFFGTCEPTYFLNGWLQCSRGKRRSIIDFYQIQRYYLVKPLSFKECWILVNILHRITGGFILFCGQIGRNTYHSRIWQIEDKHDLIKQLNVYYPQVKLKQDEKVQTN